MLAVLAVAFYLSAAAGVAAASAAEVMSFSDSSPPPPTSSFGEDVAFLRRHTDIIVLTDTQHRAQIAVAPAWQGRVMTSAADGSQGRGFGWINRRLIASREVSQHFNPYGGEDRLWLGPEGGQFSIYFAPDAPFDLDHWYVPRALDTLPFRICEQSTGHVTLETDAQFTNHSGTQFQVRLERVVQMLEPRAVWDDLGFIPRPRVAVVGYESVNTLTNAGGQPWRKESGLLSLWVLGMFNPSPEATIVVPIRPGAEAEPGPIVTSDYFGAVPPERLRISASAIFLRADGHYRSKIGVNPRRSLARLGSYDAQQHVLTIVQFTQAPGVTEYVNSLWRLQRDPFDGDALNAYNDGPPAPGVAPMGPFYELESSSPAAELQPGESLSHTHRTIHLTGSETELDPIARAVLVASLVEIRSSSPHP